MTTDTRSDKTVKVARRGTRITTQDAISYSADGYYELSMHVVERDVSLEDEQDIAELRDAIREDDFVSYEKFRRDELGL